MLLHNLKIALRNLEKYKLQTLISVLSIAISIVVLAAAHSYVQTCLQPPPICHMPYYDRVCRLTIDSLNAEEKPGYLNFNKFDGGAMRAMLKGGEFHCVEGGLTFIDEQGRYNQIRVYTADSVQRKSQEYLVQVEARYPHFLGFRSALTGKQIAPLRPGEAIVSEATAKKFFGDANPVGQTLHRPSDYHSSKELTVADVYANPGKFVLPVGKTILFANDEDATIEGVALEKVLVGSMIMILKDGCTIEQLKEEADRRLAPLGMKAIVEWQKDIYENTTNRIVTMQTLIYLMASLILLAACIGFLRMQLQLFWMRKREFSLRIVNGAKRRNLFFLLMTEVAVVLTIATALALLFGSYLEPFANTLNNNIERDDLRIMEHVLPYSASIGAGLLCLFGAVVWFALSRICRDDYNLATGMRGSRSHLFRNAMLWLQVSVGMLFVSAAFFAAYVCDKRAQTFELPENDRPFKESMIVITREATDDVRLLDSLKALPAVAQAMPHFSTFMDFDEITLRDSLTKALWGTNDFDVSVAQDSALLDFYGVRVKWLRPELKGEHCILIQEEMYAVLEREGILANGILTKGVNWGGESLPVAGTFDAMAYEKRGGMMKTRFIIMEPGLQWVFNILVPKPGRYEELWSAAEATIARLEPTVVNPMLFNFYDGVAPEVEMLVNIRKGSWLLGAVALLICLMGIYSTISLDTRARRKEVAIRKINGARSKDIALLFARLYFVLTTLALAVSIPLGLVLQNIYVENYSFDLPINTLTVVGISFGGCAIVVLAIAIIVGRQVHSIMRINPSEMIAKE